MQCKPQRGVCVCCPKEPRLAPFLQDCGLFFCLPSVCTELGLHFKVIPHSNRHDAVFLSKGLYTGR